MILYFFLLIPILYILLIVAFSIGFFKLKPFIPSDEKPMTRFSIIVPFRNEAENLFGLIASIEKLNYPKQLFEVLFVNDASEDASAEIIANTSAEKFTFSLLENQRKSASPKKDAIETAIQESHFEWLVTTDADCTLPPDWLRLLDAFIQQQNPLLVAGPVCYSAKNNLLEGFQAMDFFSLMGSTMGSFGLKRPFMCNGANLAYKKAFFLEANGYKGNEGFAGGDDIFLLEKALKINPKSVMFLKNTGFAVSTKPQKNLPQLLHQRVRWAAKATAYKSLFAKAVGLLVFLMNLGLVLLFMGVLVGWSNRYFFWAVLGAKCIVDFMLICQTALFFNKQQQLLYFLPSSVLYPFFSVLVVFRSILGGFNWKGRHFKK